MAKKRKPADGRKPASEDRPATLKDLLKPEILDRLRAQANEIKAEEDRRLAEKKRQADEARKAEQKRLDNDFGHLLETSSQDWRKFK